MHTSQQPIHYIPYPCALTHTHPHPPTPTHTHTHTGAQHPSQLKCALQSGQHPHSTTQRTTNLCTLQNAAIVTHGLDHSEAVISQSYNIPSFSTIFFLVQQAIAIAAHNLLSKAIQIYHSFVIICATPNNLSMVIKLLLTTVNSLPTNEFSVGVPHA